jgi:hypothetical protein
MVHIVGIWEGDVVGTCAVLILGLEEDDRAAIGDLCLCYDRRDMLDVVL